VSTSSGPGDDSFPSPFPVFVGRLWGASSPSPPPLRSAPQSFRKAPSGAEDCQDDPEDVHWAWIPAKASWSDLRKLCQPKSSGKVDSGGQFEKVLVGSGNELTQDHQGSGGSGVSRGGSSLAPSWRQACVAGSLERVDRLPVQGWGHHGPTVQDLGDACVFLRSNVLDNLLKL